ncbi:cache domain-containing protein [Vibrio sp. YMD68]|uniref:bifunctional diguanylate cyclase/phosphodiesterase n=1 Tax=Vibrio sp. YMD68 TaxID=3042300 RepID=UPI002499DC4E|nr:cache domain-containing protein [Vibrio sp. YMD68]WGW01344.1 cache domain-containing protein [Vibrio sp. YMD68]
MSITSDQKLLRLIKYLPMVIIGLSLLVLITIVLSANRTALKEDLATLHTGFYQTQRDTIQYRVANVIEQIEFEKSNTENILKNDIKNRVDEAVAAANNIYAQNQHLDKSIVSKMITDALRPIRFNNDRGYFFIYQLDGTNVMHPILPHVEGKSLWDLQDARGAYVIRDSAELAQTQTQAFHRWWWVKPDAIDQEFDKIGYLSLFEPFDWFIGAGEYVVDVEEDIQHRLIQRFSDYSYGEGGYIFIMNSNGELISHPNQSLIGVGRLDAQDGNGTYYVQELINQARNGGGFVEYQSSYTPVGTMTPDKLSYVNYLPDWDWVIGTGVYTEKIDSFLAEREALIQQKNSEEVLKITFLGIVVSLVLAALSLFIGNTVGRRFLRLQHKINQDFHELEETKNQLQYLALHDSLTKLPNRVFLIDFINQQIKQCQGNGKYTAIMFVDLDDFKKVNDAFGHSTGDQLLAQIGAKFETLLNQNEIVARFGGDEFVFCFSNLSNVLEAENRGVEICQIFQEEFLIAGKVISSSCSVGVSIYPQDARDAEDLIAKADTALYTSKARKKGNVLFYDESINRQVQYELSLENELRCALKLGELYMVYQPQIDLNTGKLQSVEALIRWNNPLLGHVSPVELIRKAEEIGLIHEVGLFVIERSCQEIINHYPNGDDSLALSINVSPSQLIAKNFIHDLTSTVDRLGIDRHRITVEITENVLINDLEIVTPILKQLRESHFSISLDDFGTGFSSLSYLSNLPITEIKIDRSFIDKLLVSKQSDALIKAIIAIGDSHSLKVVAEGIESLEQYQKLNEYQCNLGQGYYFSKPILMNELVNYRNDRTLA